MNDGIFVPSNFCQPFLKNYARGDEKRVFFCRILQFMWQYFGYLCAPESGRVDGPTDEGVWGPRIGQVAV